MNHIISTPWLNPKSNIQRRRTSVTQANPWSFLQIYEIFETTDTRLAPRLLYLGLQGCFILSQKLLCRFVMG